MVTRPRPNALRYFLVIGLHPVYALVVLGAIVLVGMVTLMLQPQELDEGLGMVAVGQMFLASTGFAGRARRGHFDPLLVGAPDRMRVAAAHWLASTLPGVLAWLLLTTTGSVLGSAHALSAIGGSRAVALVIVSALSWAAGFWLPRGAAGMLWMALLMVLVLQRAELLAVPAGSGFAPTLALHAATLIVCPFLLLGKHPPLAQGAVVIAMVVPLILLLSVCRRSRQLDVYLVDRS
jgi:hypothetical protein